MSLWLKQSTAVTLTIGPFVSSSDGFTAQTGLSLVQASIRLIKNGAAYAQKGETTAPAHQENGNYSCLLNTTDTGTLGVLRLHVNFTGALPVWLDMMVVPANVWDSMFGASVLNVNVNTIAANAITASAIQADAITAAKIADGAIDANTFAAGAITSTTIATNAIDSAQLAAGAGTEIAAAVKALVVETAGSYTLGQALSIMLAVLAGRTSSAGATIATPDGSTTRVAATIDASNNRTGMTLTPSA
jgi:hypothetical protein